jgi:hypothetical protein
MQNVSRNGTMLLNLTQHGRGDLDRGDQICGTRRVVETNGEAVYDSAP